MQEAPGLPQTRLDEADQDKLDELADALADLMESLADDRPQLRQDCGAARGGRARAA